MTTRKFKFDYKCIGNNFDHKKYDWWWKDKCEQPVKEKPVCETDPVSDCDTGCDKTVTTYGTAGIDVLTGGSNIDIIYGLGGADKIRGGECNDTLYGGADKDFLYGNVGDDLLYGQTGEDNLYGGTGDDVLYGNFGRDWLYGGRGHDILKGGNDADCLYGQAGDDWLNAGAKSYAADYLNGGTGNDVLIGGKGRDTLFGGAGNDVFIFNLGDGTDKLWDFESGVDTLQFVGETPGVTATQTGDDVRVDYDGGRVFVYDAWVDDVVDSFVFVA